MQEEEHLRNEKIHMSELDHPFITKLIRTFKDAKNVRRIKAIFWALICSLSPSLFLQSYSIGSSAKEAGNLWENIPVLPLYFFCFFSPRMQKFTIKEKHQFWVSCNILASPLMLAGIFATGADNWSGVVFVHGKSGALARVGSCILCRRCTSCVRISHLLVLQ
jgi:hypothetical protein